MAAVCAMSSPQTAAEGVEEEEGEGEEKEAYWAVFWRAVSTIIQMNI